MFCDLLFIAVQVGGQPNPLLKFRLLASSEFGKIVVVHTPRMAAVAKTKPPPKAGVPKAQRECDLVSTP